MGIAAGFFIIFPPAATLIGLNYLRMFYKVRAIFSCIAGLLWVAYSIYETLMYTRVLCTGECNIRIDLLMIYPLLIVVSLLATGLHYVKKRKMSNAGKITQNKADELE